MFSISCNQIHEKKLILTHLYIDPSTPGEGWGMGGPAVGDFDGDGDMDAAISRRTTSEAYWYERESDSAWTRHVMGKSPGLGNALGAAALDIDADGWIDVVFNQTWFKNPGSPGNKVDDSWAPFPFAGSGHDIIAADINLDDRTDIVNYTGDTLSWYDPASGLELNLISSGYSDHGGVAPKGVGDIDGDQKPDVVIPGYWFENPGNGIDAWPRHEWPFTEIPGTSYGRSMRVWVTDINKDGMTDILYSHCDTGGSHVYWIENKGRGLEWADHQLPDPPVRDGDVPGTGSFHSLGIADFDLDGDLDIFAGEQEDPDTQMESEGKVAMKPRGLKERGVIWENTGINSMVFNPVVFQIDNPGWHEAVVTDVDGDGDIDIISKIWNADGPAYHVDFWRNDLIR